MFEGNLPLGILVRSAYSSAEEKWPTDSNSQKKLKDFHDVFHVSLLRKCLQVPEKPNAFPKIDHKSIDLNQDLSYRERPYCILDEDIRQTRRRKIKFYKVQWTNHTPEEATWEREEYLRTEFPDFLPSQE